jgi:ATP-binding cassette subfamily B protein
VGENGAGKTTLIKLLLRQYAPSSGEILVNGIRIQDLQQDAYYRFISNLSQDFLMVNHLTIRDNLLMGLGHQSSDKDIQQALELAGADTIIKNLEHALEQRLDPSFADGTGLSGGQNQRLGVARALLRGGDLMILDEPTSAIDAKAEYSIFNNIYKYHGTRTTLIVSHRFSTVRKAEKIIVMDGGKITEYGSHKELIEYGGLYKEMFETQAEGYR